MNLLSAETQNLFKEVRLALVDVAELDAEVKTAIQNLEEAFLLVVVGEFNSGKSSFLNALLGQNTLEEGVTPTTDRIVILVKGEKKHATTVSDFIVRQELPFEFLENVALVDTPGTNAVIRRHQELTESFLPRADLVLFITSADRPFAESEREFLVLSQTWGRKVVLVINKADLLTQSEQNEVEQFVKSNAKDVLGLEPPVFLISTKEHKAGSNQGFLNLIEYLRQTLQEKDRIRLKLLSALNLASRLIDNSQKKEQNALNALKKDLDEIEKLKLQLEFHRRELLNELDGFENKINVIVDQLERRAELYLDETLRLGKMISLLSPDRLKREFIETVIQQTPYQLEKQVNELIDRFIDKNTHFWEEILAFLAKQDKVLLRFEVNRQSLLASIGQTAENELERLDERGLATRLANEAQSAVIQSGIAGIGGLGLGTILVAALTTIAGNVIGVFIGLGLLGAGFFILPRRKALAKKEIKQKLETLKAQLFSKVREQFELEADRSNAKLNDAISPYTRFVLTESEKIKNELAKAEKLSTEIKNLKNKVENL